MRNLRIAIYSTLVLLSCIAIQGNTTAQDSTPAAVGTPGTEQTEWLLTLNFRSAQLTTDSSSGESVSIELSGVDTDALAFTDRPERLVALLAAGDFVQLINSSESDPLNAVLVSREPLSREVKEMVVELQTATYDEDAATIGITGKVLWLGEEGTPTAVNSLTNDQVRAGYLFIDGVSNQNMQTAYMVAMESYYTGNSGDDINKRDEMGG